MERDEENAVIRDDKHGFDQRDVSLKGVSAAVALLLAGLTAVVFLLKPLFSFETEKHHLTQSALGPLGERFEIRKRFPAPRIQPSPDTDLERFRAREEDILTRYGWDDEKRGLVRVPVREGMRRFMESESSKGGAR